MLNRDESFFSQKLPIPKCYAIVNTKNVQWHAKCNEKLASPFNLKDSQKYLQLTTI